MSYFELFAITDALAIILFLMIINAHLRSKKLRYKNKIGVGFYFSSHQMTIYLLNDIISLDVMTRQKSVK